jgi:hypothetical protein
MKAKLKVKKVEITSEPVKLKSPKNFLLFIYRFEYPRGGFRDFVKAFHTEKSAHKYAAKIIAEDDEMAYHIFHISSRNVIFAGGKKPLRSLNTNKEAEKRLQY